MGRVIYHPMMVDWSNREAVIEYARSFGKERTLTVVKIPGRKDIYNIVATRHESELPEGTEIVLRTNSK